MPMNWDRKITQMPYCKGNPSALKVCSNGAQTLLLIHIEKQIVSGGFLTEKGQSTEP